MNALIYAMAEAMLAPSACIFADLRGNPDVPPDKQLPEAILLVGPALKRPCPISLNQTGITIWGLSFHGKARDVHLDWGSIRSVQRTGHDPVVFRKYDPEEDPAPAPSGPPTLKVIK